ncbi:hypothetical protein [Bradyrhizobium sp. SZCCHNR2009]|uniref:hypothetical protein n=1 Tax=Bradyrhizobium sp. SZCCHNR2009 TaxID=3057375 RepID=UPI0028E1FCF5|nr:hypothetical protein [Bradyrhizobium sp. SZCCHNR2009]
MSDLKSIEVFQDLLLRVPGGELSSARSALLKHVAGQWVHAPEAEKTLKRNTSLDGDVIAFQPAGADAGFLVEVTSSSQSLHDMSSPEIAAALSRFSSAANKSTGSTHPADRKRWMHFLVLAHQSGRDLDAEFLARWLSEIEGWDEESAHDLRHRI